MSDSDPVPLASVIGQNCRRLRTTAGVTQNDLAKHGRDAGLRWTASKVGDFESGRTAPSFATVLAAASALSAATKINVQLADLVESEEFVEITDKLDPIGNVLAAVIRGERTWASLVRREVGYFAKMPVDLTGLQEWSARLADESKRYPAYGRLATSDVLAVLSKAGLDESRVAKRMGVTDLLLACASWKLWRRSFSEERDHRAGKDANAQKRGRLSRLLQAELATELERASADGDDQ